MLTLIERSTLAAFACIRPRAGLASVVVLVLGSLACTVSPEGYFDSLSVGTYGPDTGGGDVVDDTAADGADGVDDTGGDPFPPDAEACEFEGVTCANCCMTDQPPGFLVPGACPSTAFPTNWSCVSDECRHENGGGDNGCNSHADCSNLLEGYVCVIVGGKGRCAPGCDAGNGNDDCLDADGHGLPPGFQCDTVASTALGAVDFCLQPVP